MTKLSNLLLMISYLQSGKKYTIKELSEKLEVSQRQIRSYKEDLEKAGIYIDTIMGPYGGYILNQSIKIPIRNFKNKDCELLNKYIDLEKNESLKKDLILLQNKIKGISINNSQKEKNLNPQILAIYNILAKAIKYRQKLLINYYSYNKGENKRIICPVEMFLFQDGWYVAAFCLTKNDIRHFELNRIKSLEILDEYF